MGKQRGGNTHDDIFFRVWFAIIVFGFMFCLALAVWERRKSEAVRPESEADPWTKEDTQRVFFFVFGVIALLICCEIWRLTT